MDVIGYARVSTVGQATDGEGLPIQEKAIRRFVRDGGHRLIAIHRDEGVSGSLADRPGLGAALLAVEEGQAEALVVHRLDRLARHLIVQETILERLAELGRHVMSVTEPDLDGDPTRDLIRQVLGAVAQYERSIITARMQAGRAAKHAKGGFAFGSPAYGYRSVNKELVADPEEQGAISLMRRWRDEGLSLQQIAERLDTEGYPPKRGERWTKGAVQRVLKRELKPAA